MGYTNYFKITGYTPERFATFQEAAVTLCTELGIKQYDSMDAFDAADIEGNAFPNNCGYVLYEDQFALYGPYESLNIERKNRWSFCKTNHKDYDPLVKLLMCMATHYMGGYVSADESDPMAENFMETFNEELQSLEKWSKVILQYYSVSYNISQYLKQ